MVMFMTASWEHEQVEVVRVAGVEFAVDDSGESNKELDWLWDEPSRAVAETFTDWGEELSMSDSTEIGVVGGFDFWSGVARTDLGGVLIVEDDVEEIELEAGNIEGWVGVEAVNRSFKIALGLNG